MKNKNKQRREKKKKKLYNIFSNKNKGKKEKSINYFDFEDDEASTGYQKYSRYAKRYQCHVGPIEIIPNFFLGSSMESIAMVEKYHVDTLVPLDHLSPTVWDKGFRGEVFYYPCSDYGVLPVDIAEKVSNIIIDHIKEGKKVGLFCVGGHGRTGYIAAIVLGKMGFDDPISFIRKNYCDNAVESNIQIRQIAKIIDAPYLIDKYEEKWEGFYLNNGSYKSYEKSYDDGITYPNYKDYRDNGFSALSASEQKWEQEHFGEPSDSSKKEPQEILEPKVCKECDWFWEGQCKQFGIPRRESDMACEDALNNF